jgi:hypothetical protein
VQNLLELDNMMIVQKETTPAISCIVGQEPTWQNAMGV